MRIAACCADSVITSHPCACHRSLAQKHASHMLHARVCCRLSRVTPFPAAPSQAGNHQQVPSRVHWNHSQPDSHQHARQLPKDTLTASRFRWGDHPAAEKRQLRHQQQRLCEARDICAGCRKAPKRHRVPALGVHKHHTWFPRHDCPRAECHACRKQLNDVRGSVWAAAAAKAGANQQIPRFLQRSTCQPHRRRGQWFKRLMHSSSIAAPRSKWHDNRAAGGWPVRGQRHNANRHLQPRPIASTRAVI